MPEPYVVRPAPGFPGSDEELARGTRTIDRILSDIRASRPIVSPEAISEPTTPGWEPARPTPPKAAGGFGLGIDPLGLQRARDLAETLGRGMEWAQRNVVEPTAELVAAPSLEAIKPSGVPGLEQPFGAFSELVRKTREVGFPQAWQEAAQRYRERPELFPAQKGILETAIMSPDIYAAPLFGAGAIAGGIRKVGTKASPEALRVLEATTKAIKAQTAEKGVIKSLAGLPKAGAAKRAAAQVTPEIQLTAEEAALLKKMPLDEIIARRGTQAVSPIAEAARVAPEGGREVIGAMEAVVDESQLRNFIRELGLEKVVGLNPDMQAGLSAKYREGIVIGLKGASTQDAKATILHEVGHIVEGEEGIQASRLIPLSKINEKLARELDATYWAIQEGSKHGVSVGDILKITPKIKGKFLELFPEYKSSLPAFRGPATIAKRGGVPPTKPPVPPTGEVPPTGAEVPPELPPGAVKRVLDRVSMKEKQPGVWDKIRSGWDTFQETMIDDLYPLRRFVEEAQKIGGPILALDDPYTTARLIRGLQSKVNVFLEQGTFGKQYWKVVNGKAIPNFTGPGLKQILQPMAKGEAWQDFIGYITARRAGYLNKRGIKTGIDQADALAAVKELEAKYPEVSRVGDQFHEFLKAPVRYLHEKGMITQELYDKLVATEFYAPFYRVMDEVQRQGFLGKKLASISQPIKRQKGSERLIVNPVEGAVKNVHAFISAADRNDVGVMMANLVAKNPELAELFRPIKAPIARVARVTAKELGIELEGLSAKEAEQVFDIFRPSFFSPDNVVSVLVNGKKKFFQVDPDLYRGIMAMNREDFGMLTKVLGLPARILRAGATALSPDFVVRNPVMDTMTAYSYSRYGFIPGFDTLRGLSDFLGASDMYTLYKMSGADHAALVSVDRQYLTSTLGGLLGKESALSKLNVLNGLRAAGEAMETATRLGEFSRGIRAGALPAEAGFAGREVTLDFSRAGTTGRALNSIIAFFNANVQGVDKLVRQFKTKPIQTGLKVFSGITVPSLLLYASNRLDPRWKEIPQYQKDLNWIVLIPGVPVMRIPKPRDLGILFGSIPERFFEFLDTQDPEIIDKAFRQAVTAGTPGYLPTGIEPIIENLTNYSFFTGRPIVSEGRQAMPSAFQYTGSTSETAKKLGELTNQSPAMVDNLIYGWTGTLGRYTVGVLDRVLKGTGISPNLPEPSPVLADIPIIRGFTVRDPYGSASASVDKFYDTLGKIEGHERYMKELLKKGSVDAFQSYNKTHPEVLMAYDFETKDQYSASARVLRRVSSQLSELNKKATQVYDHPTMTPQEKRATITEIDKLKTQLASNVLDVLKGSAKPLGATQPQAVPKTVPVAPTAIPVSPNARFQDILSRY